MTKAGRSILVVEDQSVIATWLQLRLERLGYAVLDSAADAADAIDKATALAPDVVLMDVHLAGGSDGVAAAQEIRERQGIPVILVTGSVDDDTLRRAREAGVDGFIQKPFDERELHTAIQTALARRRLALTHVSPADGGAGAGPHDWRMRALLHRLSNELAVTTAMLEMLQAEQQLPVAVQAQVRAAQERLAVAGQVTAQIQRAIRGTAGREEPASTPRATAPEPAEEPALPDGEPAAAAVAAG